MRSWKENALEANFKHASLETTIRFSPDCVLPNKYYVSIGYYSKLDLFRVIKMFPSVILVTRMMNNNMK